MVFNSYGKLRIPDENLQWLSLIYSDLVPGVFSRFAKAMIGSVHVNSFPPSLFRKKNISSWIETPTFSSSKWLKQIFQGVYPNIA